tara:strand:- start:2749 stop:3159 length:411 start_codon:yes stop_codon:yes gene_type:complete
MKIILDIKNPEFAKALGYVLREKRLGNSPEHDEVFYEAGLQIQKQVQGGCFTKYMRESGVEFSYLRVQRFNPATKEEEPLEFPVEILMDNRTIGATYDELHADQIVSALRKQGSWIDGGSLDYDPDEESYTKEGMI